MVTLFYYSVIELENNGGQNFKVNGRRVKHYLSIVEEVKVVCDVNVNGA